MLARLIANHAVLEPFAQFDVWGSGRSRDRCYCLGNHVLWLWLWCTLQLSCQRSDKAAGKWVNIGFNDDDKAEEPQLAERAGIRFTSYSLEFDYNCDLVTVIVALSLTIHHCFLHFRLPRKLSANSEAHGDVHPRVGVCVLCKWSSCYTCLEFKISDSLLSVDCLEVYCVLYSETVPPWTNSRNRKWHRAILQNNKNICSFVVYSMLIPYLLASQRLSLYCSAH